MASSHLSPKREAKKIVVGKTMVAYEYPLMDSTLHGALADLRGRYPEQGWVVNEKCAELIYVVKGAGKLILENEQITFEEGDQLFIKAGEKYYWEAIAVLYMPCTPAWYAEQHKELTE